jgi:hypothetical protein
MLHDELLLLRRIAALGAVAFCAIARTSEGAAVKVVPESGTSGSCIVHFTSDKDADQRVACSETAKVNGTTTAWVEQRTGVTPYLTDVTSGGTFRVGGFVPKGMLRVALRAGEHVRVISLVSPRDEHSLRSVFVRDIADVAIPITVPAGRVLALRLDPKSHVTAFAEATVPPDREMTASWSAPSRGSAALLAVVRKTDNGLSLTASDASGVHPPSVLVSGADTTVAFWRSIAGGGVRLSAEAEKSYLPETLVETRPGDIATTETEMRRLPSASITIAALPADVRAPEMRLSISPFADVSKTIRRLDVRPGRTYVVDALPASLLTVDLHIGEFVLEKTADLTSGSDASLLLSPEPLRVSGVVYRGHLPIRAQVRFLQKGAPVAVSTDDSGAYEATLWQRRRYIVEAVVADDPNAPAFSQDVAITSSRQLDIQIPGNSLSVRVLDSENAKPIETAKIMLHNAWSGGSSALVIPTTGVITRLPPQRIGTTEIRIHAEGFTDSATVTVPIDDALGEKTIDFALTREKDVIRVTVRLESGQVAAGAELAAWSSADEMTWRGVADDAGEVAVPRSIAGQAIIVRHPEAASLAVILGSDQSSNAINLSAPAPPLIVRVIRNGGEAARPVSARVTLTQRGGRRLTGQKVAFATWSLGATTPDGLFVARGLPRQPLHLVATQHATTAQIETGAYDGLATTIPFPWGARNTVAVADP